MWLYYMIKLEKNKGRTKMEKLSLKEKIGQMLIIKIQGKEITNETKRMIEEYKVGGIILYRKNVKR